MQTRIHKVRNVLSGLKIAAETLRDCQLDDADRRATADSICDDVGRMDALITGNAPTDGNESTKFTVEISHLGSVIVSVTVEKK